MDATNGHGTNVTQPIKTNPEYALVFDGRPVLARRIRFNADEELKLFHKAFKQTRRATRLVKLLQFIGLARLLKPKIHSSYPFDASVRLDASVPKK